MLQEQTIPIDFGGGVDTKSDPKQVVPMKLTYLQNGIFTNKGRITKRNGYDQMTNTLVGGSGSWSSPTMTRYYRNELTLASSVGSTNPKFLSYSSSLNAWEVKGKYKSVAVTKQTISAALFKNQTFSSAPTTITGIINSSCCVIGNYAVYLFDEQYRALGSVGSSGGQSFYTIVDLSTGNQIQSSIPIPNSIGYSKICALGTSVFGLFYISTTAANQLSCITISISGNTVTTGSENVIGTCSSGTTPFLYSYDVANTSTGAIVAFENSSSGHIVLQRVNTSGSTTGSAVNITVSGAQPLSINTDLTNSLAWVYWWDGSAFHYAIYSLALIVVNQFTITTSATNFSQIAAVSTGATSQKVFYSYWTYQANTVATQTIEPSILSAIVTTSGVTSSDASVQENVDIYGKIFTQNSTNYLPVIGLSSTSTTAFIIDITNDTIPQPIAKFAQEEAEGLYSAPSGQTGGTIASATLTAIRYPSFISQPQALQSSSPTSFLMAAGYVSNQTITPQTNSGNASAYLLEAITPNLGVNGYTFDFNNIDANQAIIQQDTLVLNGGVLMMYDGAQCVELGYNLDPDNIVLDPRTIGGNMLGTASGGNTYIYYAIWEWIDANGNLYQSAPSPPIAAFFNTGTTNSVGVTIPSLTMTAKNLYTSEINQILVKVYRSSSALGGNLAYLVAVIDNPAFLGTLSVNFIDTFADSSIQNNQTLYTQNGAILENIAPPPAMIMWLNNNRIWCVDSTNAETTIEYSKTASAGTGISFSTGQLEVVIDSRAGVITGASQMDEKTVIFKQRGLGFFIGDGANDAGTNTTISNFQFIPSDTGCTNSKSVILYPQGLLYRTLKGIYQLNRGLQTQYFGTDVEAYNSQDIQSSVTVPNKTQIRFLTSSGLSLLFDYYYNQWSVFTNHQGLSATSWNGLYVYVRTDGNLYLEDETSFLDNTSTITLLAQSAWLRAQSIQNFQRIRRYALLGDFANGSSASYAVQASFAYDFGTTLSALPLYTFGAASASGYFQYRERLQQQKCDAVQLQIEDLPTGASGEYFDITNMSFEAGAKSGINKMSQNQTVA